jgi:asparagine synthase (glutamine-hydrolysing)
MCGICGVVLNDGGIIRTEEIRNMLSLLMNRGPDDEGIWIKEGIGLGHRRLSIIDLETGHQPMCNEDGTIWIVYNGEVYNYPDLRKELELKGHKFRTTSDTEVIIHLYEEYGTDSIRILNGMFAFAIWDESKKLLCLARDRVGIKPLYYAIRDEKFVFSSNIKPILQYFGQKPEVNLKLIPPYFSMGYSLGEETIFKGIFKLQPGSLMVLSGSRLDRQKYWNLRFTPLQRNTKSRYIEEMKHVLTESVRSQLRSDVPLGVFLSGGIDSSSITGLVSKLTAIQVKTFSAVFRFGQRYDESYYSRLCSKHFGTDNHEVIVDLESFRNFIPGFVLNQEEPTTDPSGIPLYFVAKLAREHVKVVLSGEGSDEMFGGYTIYRHMGLMEKYRVLPEIFRKHLLDRIARLLFRNGKVNRFIEASERPIENRYRGVYFYDDDLMCRALSPDFKNSFDMQGQWDILKNLYRIVSDEKLINKLLFIDTNIWLPEDILLKSDRMSMAASIELRVPFLDNSVIDFASCLPVEYKLSGISGKYILKKAMGDLLPREIISRRKMGFPVPLGDLFRGGLREDMTDLLNDRRTRQRGYYNLDYLKKCFAEHVEGKADYHKILWAFYVLEVWHRELIDGIAS